MPSRPGYHRPHLLFHHLSSPPRDPGLGSWFCSNTPGSYSFPDSPTPPQLITGPEPCHPSWKPVLETSFMSQDVAMAQARGLCPWRRRLSATHHVPVCSFLSKLSGSLPHIGAPERALFCWHGNKRSPGAP